MHHLIINPLLEFFFCTTQTSSTSFSCPSVRVNSMVPKLQKVHVFKTNSKLGEKHFETKRKGFSLFSSIQSRCQDFLKSKSMIDKKQMRIVLTIKNLQTPYKGRVQKKKSGIFQIWFDPPTHPCNRGK